MKPEEIIAGLLPEVAFKAREHLAKCFALGIDLLVTSGWRSSAQQMVEFTKGRVFNATQGIWHVVEPKRVSTNAMPDHAPHCRGAAYDLVPVVNGHAAWDNLELFQRVGEVGEKLGLVWGGRWPKLKDMPHFEIPNWRGLPLKEN